MIEKIRKLVVVFKSKARIGKFFVKLRSLQLVLNLHRKEKPRYWSGEEQEKNPIKKIIKFLKKEKPEKKNLKTCWMCSSKFEGEGIPMNLEDIGIPNAVRCPYCDKYRVIRFSEL